MYSTSPLERASLWLTEHPGSLVITQRGVETLRAGHPERRILDAFYEASASYVATRSRETPVLRVSATPPIGPWSPVACFEPRFPGEPGLCIYATASAAPLLGPTPEPLTQ